MKKLITLTLIVLALGFASCHRNKANQTPADQPEDNPEAVLTTEPSATAMEVEEQMEPMSYKSADFLYVEGGDIYFYDVESRKAMRYPNESDEVVDAVCTTHGMVYYNAVSNGRLLLKRINLNKTDPMPTVLADWNVDLEEENEYGYPPYGEMYLDQEENRLCLEVELTWLVGTFSNLEIYDFISKTVTKYERYGYDPELDMEVDFPDESNFDRYVLPKNFDPALFEDTDCLYYFGRGRHICMNDQIDDLDLLSIDLEGFALDHLPIAIDPSGTKLLFEGIGVLGDAAVGYYAVSTLDGIEQQVISDLEEMGPMPRWLKDGSLLFAGYDSDSALFMMDPDGEIHTIAHTMKFCVLP